MPEGDVRAELLAEAHSFSVFYSSGRYEDVQGFEDEFLVARDEAQRREECSCMPGLPAGEG